MSSQVPILCGPDDDRALIEFVKSIGLRLLPFSLEHLDRKTGETVFIGDAKKACYLSFLPADQLHPYSSPKGTPPVRIGDATDPLIEFSRSYYDPPYIVAGRIYWKDTVAERAKLTKPYFDKVARWIRKNWKKRDIDRFYMGPQAEKLLREGAKAVALPPGVNVKTIEI